MMVYESDELHGTKKIESKLKSQVALVTLSSRECLLPGGRGGGDVGHVAFAII